MARQVVWSAGAEADIAENGSYLVRVASPAVATSVVTKIRDAASKCRDFPYSARIIPEFQDPDRRATFAYAYRLMYRIKPNSIYILRVVHGRRLLKNVPGSFEEPQQQAYSAA